MIRYRGFINRYYTSFGLRRPLFMTNQIANHSKTKLKMFGIKLALQLKEHHW